MGQRHGSAAEDVSEGGRMPYDPSSPRFPVICSFSALLLCLLLTAAAMLSGCTHASRSSAAAEGPRFTFPTSENDAPVRFTSFPDLFNWNIANPQPGWEDAIDWFLTGMEKEGPSFALHAGDIMDARWWSGPQQIRKKTGEYWGGFARRFTERGIDLYPAPGDHEYGDDRGLRKPELAPVFAEQFAAIFDPPRNGPAHKKGLAYSISRENLAVISVDTFEHAGDRMSITVSGRQLEWFREQLREHRRKEFIIVQGHVPVFGPVASRDSSANMLEGGTGSAFWKAMVEHGVDVYLCGEHHRITARRRDGIWQIVHGALWGTQRDLNYLRGSVFPGRLELELFTFEVDYGGWYLGGHPHRWWFNRPREQISISPETRRKGPERAGILAIEARPGGNVTVRADGVFGQR